MIYIKEDLTTKLPGITSIYIKTEYKAEIITAFKSFDVFSYNNKNYIWEFPTNYFYRLVKILHNYDDIAIKLYDNREIVIDKNIELLKYKFEPFEHQREAIKYCLSGHNKFLLLDEPGLGKTNSTIGIAEELYSRKEVQHCLVVCGVNTLTLNWRAEINKFSTLGCRILGERVNRKGRLVIDGLKKRIEDLYTDLDEFFLITNIQSLRNKDFVTALNANYNRIDMMVIDEIHRLGSSVSTEQTRGLLKLRDYKYKIGLTGTIMTNTPLNLYIPLKWIGEERSTFTNFKKFYCTMEGYYNTIVSYKHLDLLKNQLSSCSLRRTKNLLNLPEKNIINEIVEMEEDQRKFYNEVKEGEIDNIDKIEDIDPSNVLAMLTRLRQVTSCPDILTSAAIYSSKINRALDLTEQILSGTDEKIVIFSMFKRTLEVLEGNLLDYNPLVCTGDIKDVERMKNIEMFQNDNEHRIILATPQAMGVGVTLHRASYEIFIDCPYTHADNLQCQDRIHRIGAKRPVFIYYLWNADSVDMRIKDIVENKEALGDFLVDGSCPPKLMHKLKKIVEDLKNDK